MNAPTLKLLLSGSSGRMGQLIERIAAQRPDLEIVGRANQDQWFDSAIPADVLVDFSLPDLCRRSLEFALHQQLPMVIGTTGIDDDLQHAIQQAAAYIPICQAANFSIGVEVLRSALRQIARQLAPDFTVSISETHHRGKLDAPSGTAIVLARTLSAEGARSDDAFGQNQSMVHAVDHISIHSARESDVIGEHAVVFKGVGEQLDLKHRATDRSVFALGALRAAAWLAKQPAGLYALRDMLETDSA